MSEIIKREFVIPPPTNKTLTVTLRVTERQREILRAWIGKRSGKDIQNDLTAIPYEYDEQGCARYVSPPTLAESNYLIDVLYKLFEPE